MNFFKSIFKRLCRRSQSEALLALRQDFLATVDIRRLPPAVGFLRDVQLADVELLRETLRVAALVGAHPIMTGGGLIGIMRHNGGFIPWDDDIDLVLIREEYETFVDAFNANCRPGFRAYYRYWKNICRIRIAHDALPRNTTISIFVFDRYWKALPTLKEKIAFRRLVDPVQTALAKRWKKEHFDVPQHKRLFDEYRHRDILEGHASAPAAEKPALFYGAELCVYRSSTSIAFDYDDIYPLRTSQFEGVPVAIPNHPETFLTYIYGDWGTFPGSLAAQHGSSEFSAEKALALRSFLEHRSRSASAVDETPCVYSK